LTSLAIGADPLERLWDLSCSDHLRAHGGDGLVIEVAGLPHSMIGVGVPIALKEIEPDGIAAVRLGPNDPVLFRGVRSDGVQQSGLGAALMYIGLDEGLSRFDVSLDSGVSISDREALSLSIEVYRGECFTGQDGGGVLIDLRGVRIYPGLLGDFEADLVDVNQRGL
jgi:hypothetical protein